MVSGEGEEVGEDWAFCDAFWILDNAKERDELVKND